MTIVWILLVLFIALFIVIPIIEKFGPQISNESMGKMSRMIFPLIAILLITQLLFYFFNK